MATTMRGRGSRSKSARVIRKLKSSSRSREKWRPVECSFAKAKPPGNFPPAVFKFSNGLMCAVDDVGEVENRQEHADDHAADHHAEENNQDRFEQGHQAGKCGLDFLV